jgi:hypothetical protein
MNIFQSIGVICGLTILKMTKQHTYQSFYFIGNEPIEPIYIVHKAKNIKDANYNAKWYVYQYYADRNKSSMFLNRLNNTVVIKTRRLKKL